MASNYAALRAANEREYGMGIGRFGPGLLANRYADRTHFIFELLQNAEDALKRRVQSGWNGKKSVEFKLAPDALTVSHFGIPFTESDVRGICGIGESTKDKDLTAIGRFGIGFKSVYAFTDCPQVHSGDEHFAIDSFVWPRGIEPFNGKPDETRFIIPLRKEDAPASQEIAAGFRNLGPRTLLFLRQIEIIDWSIEGGPSGLYLRSEPEPLGGNARKIVVIGEEQGREDVEESWLVFSREVRGGSDAHVGYVEIAFAMAKNAASKEDSIRPITDSSAVVFFPTVVPTHLGFLVQGPYRTTPSRDNIPRQDSWNQKLVKETAALLAASLPVLRDMGFLDANTLRALPINSDQFGEGQMFAPLFHAVQEALSTQALLPRFGGGHAAATNVRLGRTQELRQLLSPSQLAALFQPGDDIFWLSEDITQDRTPELRQYLMRELEIAEVTPEMVLPKLTKAFLEAQADEWIVRLYQFLQAQPALQRRLHDLPLVRLEDGTHVVAHSNGQPQAFLPSPIKTSFPTVKHTVCAGEETRKLLQSLGLTEPDPVDDVVWNVLPKYRAEEVDVGEQDYDADIRRILAAFKTDSKGHREKLIAALTASNFVMAVDCGDGSKWVSKPSGVYLATERLKELFAGVGDVLLVDDSYTCLRGEDVRELLEACGATRYLQPIPATVSLTWEELREIRTAAGCESYSSQYPIDDHALRGLDELLDALPKLDSEARAKRSALLWEALSDVEDRRGTGIFSGTYRWHYYHPRSASFDAYFVRKLNEAAWVPDAKGELQRPEFVVFRTLGWKENPFLLLKIAFKPPVIEALAREAGIEPGVLDLLKKLGVTSAAELRARLGIKDQPEPPAKPVPAEVADAVGKLLGESPQPTPPIPDPAGAESTAPKSPASATGAEKPARERTHGAGKEEGAGGSTPGQRSTQGATDGRRTPAKGGSRPFISYVGTHPDDEGPDPDGLDKSARMALEEKAITIILSQEPEMKRTPANNPGFDLFTSDADGKPTRWVEVKAMAGALTDRPVGLSRTQFDCAREHGEAFWLYVVEHAGDDTSNRIVRIQDPARKARTFTFDHGWLEVAEIGAPVASNDETRSRSNSNGEN